MMPIRALGKTAWAPIISGDGVGTAVGIGVGLGVGVGTGVRVGVAAGEAVAPELGVGVGSEGSGLALPHHSPHILFGPAYSWIVHIAMSSTGSTTVELKSPHLLSPVPKSLKYGASPAFSITPVSIVFAGSLARRVE